MVKQYWRKDRPRCRSLDENESMWQTQQASTAIRTWPGRETVA
jgi:hypothetical protein